MQIKLNLDTSYYHLYDPEILQLYITKEQYNGLEDIVINDTFIRFKDDLWDLTAFYFEGKQKRNFIYKFDDICTEYYKELIKIFVLYSLFESSVYNSAVKHSIRYLRDFCDYCDTNDITSFSYLTVEHIQNYSTTQLDMSYRSIVKVYRAIYDFLIFIARLQNIEIGQDVMDFLLYRDNQKLNAIQKQNKRPLLPSSFVNKLEIYLYETIMDENITYKDKVFYTIYYILIQTGVRVGEACICLRDCMEHKRIDRTKNIYYFTYRTTKSIQNGYQYTQTKGNEKLYNVIMKMKLQKSNNSEFLFDFVPNTIYVNDKFKKFCLKNAVEFDLVNNNNNLMFSVNKEAHEVYSKRSMKELGIAPNDNISLPQLSQFRVYFASELHNRGVSDITIAKMLNHHDDKMLGYYGREANEVQENMSFSQNIINYVLEDTYKILGSRSEQYMEQINDFLSYDSINVVSNLEEAKEKILNTMPIRSLYGGFCMKANVARVCEFDAAVDEFYCAYGMCPNQCHFFFNLKYYYDRFLDSKAAYLHNKERNYIQMAEKELYKMQYMISKRIKPEIKELKNEMNKKSIADILSKHPELTDIVINLKEVEEEIVLWSNMKE